MIIGVGVDICMIKRIESTLDKYGTKFKERCFTQDEIFKCDKRFNPAACYAKRFAAKEAFSKAIGTGISKGVSWRNIEVYNKKSGQPQIKLHGNVIKTLDSLVPNNMIPKIFISITDEKEIAKAFIVIEAIKKG